MSKVLVSEENLTNIANAIREKNGETTTYKPGDMATAIQNISSGGDPELEASFMSSIDSTLGANVTKLPSGITSIGNGAFRGCSSLALTELPSGITSIGNNAFQNCIKLALTELPSGITSIGDSAFTYCSSLALTELPSGITSIGSQAFRYCKSLSQITINSNTLSLGTNSFGDCTNLKKIILPNIVTIPSLSSSTFSGTPIASGTGYIYVPDTLVDSFKSATNWSTYADQIKPISELEASA